VALSHFLVFKSKSGVEIITSDESLKPEERLAQLLDTITQFAEVVILPHNDPDPDAIASGAALCYLLQEAAGVKSTMMYAGSLVRAIVQTDGTAGGHVIMAAGQIPLQNTLAGEMIDRLTRRALQALNIKPDALPGLLI